MEVGFLYVFSKLIGNARNPTGGIRRWQSARTDIVKHLKEPVDRISTLMVDYYALPLDWPGREAAGNLSGARAKGQFLEQAIADAIADEMPSGYDRRRFIPYVQMHEFEALLFADCAASCNGLGHRELAIQMQTIRDEFTSPEEINDSQDTAPSKRLERLVPEYNKVLYGNLAILEIGLPTIRAACPNFDGWMTRLESIIAPTAATPLS